MTEQELSSLKCQRCGHIPMTFVRSYREREDSPTLIILEVCRQCSQEHKTIRLSPLEKFSGINWLRKWWK